MNIDKRITLSRLAGLFAVATLLAVCFVLLGGQVAKSAPESPAWQVTASSPGSITDTQILLQKNDGYYGAAGVAITQVTSYFFGQDEAWALYQAGSLDTIAPAPSAMEAIRASSVYSPQLHAFPVASTYLFGFSTDVPPFDDPLVRAALASAIDRTRLIHDFLSGDELPALTFTPPGHVGYVDGYAAGIGHPYSPTLATSLLAASGYTGTPPITLLVNDAPYHESIALAVRDSWYETLGISVTVESLPWQDYAALLRDGSAEERPGVWRMGWYSDYPDANNWHHDFFANWVGPFARYDDPSYNALVGAAAGETNLSTRLALYRQAELTLVQTDTVVAPLFTPVKHQLTRSDLLRTYRSLGGQRVDEWSFSGSPRPIEVAWGSPASLDPALSTAVDYVDQLFLGLTRFDAATGAVMPELATAWQASPDATVYTFTLRNDAHWTDGNPVIAQDVEYGVLRSLNPATGAPYAYMLYDILNAQEYNEGQITNPALVGVEALNATHIRFTLERPAAFFPMVAGLWPARPQPQWAIDTHGAAWTDAANIVTNGPYELVRWDTAPYLRIEKSAEGAPFSGNVLTFTIRYRNDGGAEAANCVITDTMLGGLSYVGDTSGLSHSGSGSGPIVWDLGTLPAYSSAQFQVTAVISSPFGQIISNRARIATGAPNDQGEAWEKESEWNERVIGPTIGVNYAEDRASGVYAVGHTFWITVTESDGSTVKATATVNSGPGGAMHDGDWNDGFAAEYGGWSPSRPDIQPGDWVLFRSDDGYDNAVQVGTISGSMDAADDTVSGTISAPWLASQTLEGRAGYWGWTWESFTVDLDSAGTSAYLVDFSPQDLPPGQAIDVKYMEPDGDYVVNNIQPPDLVMTVNYAHDWVEGNYEPGYTVWLTVTDSLGGIKATVELDTQSISWWGGRTGFSTNLEGVTWLPGRPDIQEGDWVYGIVNRGQGYTGSVRIGSISGTLDLEADTVSGTISAPWFSETLNGNCGVWVENGPGEGFQVNPNGGSYFCDFTSMGTGWDLLPGHDVSVLYKEPDGDQVINVFRSPAANMRIEKWADGSGQAMPGGAAVFNLRYRNEGDAVATTIYLTDTLPSDTTYVSDTSGVTPTVGLETVVWTLGPLGPGAERQFQLVLTNTAHPNDVLLNKADIWTLHDSDNWNNHAEAQVNVTAGLPDMFVSKNPNPGDPAPGQTMLWEIDYGNNGPVSSGRVFLTDTLPANTTIVEWSSQNGYSLWEDHSTASQLILEASAVPGHWGDRIFLRLLVDAGVPVGTQLTNTVQIATAGDVDLNNNWHTRDEVRTGSPRWDSMVDKNLGWGQLVPGGQVEYNLNVRNNGNMATHTVLTDTLPQGTSFNQSQDCSGPACVPFPPDSVVDQVAVWDLGLIDPGAGVNLNVRVDISGSVNPGAVLTNCAELEIDGQESRPKDNADCVVSRVQGPGPNLRIDKQYRWNWEGQLEYTIEFRNLGTTTLNNVKITDTLPANTSFGGNWWHWFKEGIQFEQLGNQLVWTISRLEPAWSSGIRYSVDLDGGVSGVEGLCYTNTAVAPIPGDVWPDDNHQEVTACTGPDVYVEKWLSGGVPTPGAIVTFTVELGNKSAWPWDGDVWSGSHITDTLPAGMTFISATRPGEPGDMWYPESINGNDIVWSWGTIWANNAWSFDLAVQISDTVAGGAVLTNTVTARGDNADDVEPNYANNVFALPVTILGPVLDVSKVYDTSGVAGTTVTYTLSVTNSGNAIATGVSLSDSLPIGLTYLNSNGSHVGSDVTWALSDIAAGGGTAGAWFSAQLQCLDEQAIVNDTYGVRAGGQTAVAWGEPVSFTTLAPSIQVTLDHDPEPALVGQTVYFTATASTDGSVLTYLWDFGEGAASGGPTASHAFDLVASQQITVTVTDACSYTKTALTTVQVEQALWKIHLPLVVRN